MIAALRWILLPFTLLYAIAIWVRNKLYDWQVLTSKRYPVRSIVVGNLAVGGSGKSPMTEYLIQWLKTDYRIATLSRGYGRKTKGFRYVEEENTAAEVGDEPLQFKKKFPDITVAVCEDRRKGIETLQPQHDLILLDDAFQHRRISATCNILLFEYSSILGNTLPLPTGNFRDLMNQTKRADIIVITKCPIDIPDEAMERIEHKIAKYDCAPFYSRIVYKNAIHVYEETTLLSLQGRDVLLLTGIANPKPMKQYVQAQARQVLSLEYPDHHAFSDRDYQRIRRRFSEIDSTNAIILTTTKDLQRLDLSKLEGLPLYQLPIGMALEDEEIFREDVEWFLV